MALAIILILILVAIFLISNTVRIGIAVRREEIAIMKYIGATDIFVRGPFLVEGIVIGLVGSLIPVAIIRFLYVEVVQFVTGAVPGDECADEFCACPEDFYYPFAGLPCDWPGNRFYRKLYYT